MEYKVELVEVIEPPDLDAMLKKKCKRKKVADPESWAKNVRKKLRNTGKNAITQNRLYYIYYTNLDSKYRDVHIQLHF